MAEKPYHHGDLRNSLIETGIELINENGINHFSLRRVAAICGVSHAAPYAHFKDIDDLLQAMSDHVSSQFMEALNTALQEQTSSGDDIVRKLGRAYISFFMEHPRYFQFIFYHSGTTINLDNDSINDYPPFRLFRDTAYQEFSRHGIVFEDREKLLIARWSLVHGIAALCTNSNVVYSGNWPAIIDNMKWVAGP